MMTDAEIFQAAFAKVRNPDTWTVNYYARDVSGRETSPRAADATCWCSLGAIIAVTGEPLCAPIVQRFVKALNKNVDESDQQIWLFNDMHPYSEVVALWEKTGRENGWLQ